MPVARTGAREHARTGLSFEYVLVGLVACLLSFPCITRVVGQPVVLPGENVRLHPCGACDGTFSRIAWEELRGDGSDILSARLDGDLNLLDSVPVVISAAVRNQSSPSIAWCASRFLCVWEDARNGGSDIYGARIGSIGGVLDTVGIPIRRSPGLARLPQVVAGDSGFFVVWEETPADSESFVCCARVALDGHSLDSLPIRISLIPGRQAHPSTAFEPDSDRYAVVWEQHSPYDDSVHVLCARVNCDGAVIDTAPIRVCRVASRQTAPSIAFNYYNMVVWEDDRLGLPGVFATEIRQDFSLVDTVGARCSRNLMPSSNPSASSSTPFETKWTIAWEELESDSSVALAGVYTSIPPYPGSRLISVPGANVIMPYCISNPLWLIGPVVYVINPRAREIPATIGCDWYEIAGVHQRIAMPRVQSTMLLVTPSFARDRVTVRYAVPYDGPVALDLFDMTGKLVHRLYRGRSNGEFSWSVSGVAEGIYIVRLSAPDGTATVKVIVQH